MLKNWIKWRKYKWKEKSKSKCC